MDHAPLSLVYFLWCSDYKTVMFSVRNFIRESFRLEDTSQFIRSSLSRSLCTALLLSSRSTLPPSSVSPMNLLTEHLIPLPRSSPKVLNRTGPALLPGDTVGDWTSAGQHCPHSPGPGHQPVLIPGEMPLSRPWDAAFAGDTVGVQVTHPHLPFTGWSQEEIRLDLPFLHSC